MNTSPSLRSTPIGPLLKHWRLLNRVKQLHAAQMFGVCQSTISRWESGAQDAEPEQRAHRSLAQSQAQQRRGSRVGAPCVGQLATGALGVRPYPPPAGLLAFPRS